jgi:hypothetical protein
MKRLVPALVWVVIAWGASGLTACGASGGSSSSRDAGTPDARDAASRSAFEPCPHSAPSPGSKCASYSPPVCEYGTSQDPQCDRTAACQYFVSQGPADGHWDVTDSGVCPDAGNPNACPATLADVPRGRSCTNQAATCDYPTGTCGCRTQFRQSTSTMPIWYCVDLGASCPTLRPRLGSACPNTPSVLTCDYGACFDDAHIAEICARGEGWEESNPACSLPGG